MSLNIRILLLFTFLGNWLLFSQETIDEIRMSWKNISLVEKIELIDQQLNQFKYRNKNIYEFLLDELESVSPNQLPNSTQTTRNCILIEGFIEAGKYGEAEKIIVNNIYPNKQNLNEREEFIYLWYTLYKGNINDISLTLAKKKLNNAKLKREISKISDAYKILSYYYLVAQKPDSSFYYASLSTSEAKRLSDKSKLMEAMNYQGKVYFYFENYIEAINKKLQMIQIAVNEKNDYFIAKGYYDIAIISFELQNYFQTNQYIDRAIVYFKKINDANGEFISTILKIQNNFFLGKKNDFSQLLKLKDNYGRYDNPMNKIMLSLALSYYYTERNDLKKSIDELINILPLTNSLNDEKTSFSIYRKLAKDYLKMNNLIEAEKFIKKATPLFKTTNLQIGEAYLVMAEIENKRNNILKAFEFQNNYLDIVALNERKQFSRAAEQLTESNLREEREKLIIQQQENILIEQKEKERLSFEQDRQILIGISLGVLIIMVLLIASIRLRALRSRQKQREAEMSQTLLRSQMNPHFVFNAMSVIQSYIYANDPDKSSKFLVNFSRLMRLILENSPKEMIPLELEFEILDKYLNTQKMRFEDRFTYELKFDEELLFSKAMIPPMIAQPFVENAIEHGQLHTIEGGKISVSVEKKDELLEVIIEDNGVGRKKAAKTKKIKGHKSMAIDISKERIEILNRKYQVKGFIEISDGNTNGKGTKVKILLPLKFEVT